MNTIAQSVSLSLPFGKHVRDLTPLERARLLERGRAHDAEVARSVAQVIEQVRAQGDAALREFALRFDGVSLSALEVPASRCQEALGQLPAELRAALDQAARAIRVFHEAQLTTPIEIELSRGVKLGRRAEPLRSVGVYAPGGRAAYPSSVLMGVIPAKVAGVAEVVVATPPGPAGEPDPVVLAACALAGADRVFAIGGAGAIAAFASGTASVPRVDKVVGPGNAYVTEAKRQLVGEIAIDCPAGPSEVLILADASAAAELIAYELLAQAEHDADAAAVLVATERALLERVQSALQRLVPDAERGTLIAVSLAANGALLLADGEAELLAFAEEYAPEHLVLFTRNPRATLAGVRNAGSVFLGAGSSVAFGDYLTGANHVLPTAGRARAWSGLSTVDFMRWFTYQEIDAAAAAALAPPTIVLANAEGLLAHAAAARARTLDRPVALPSEPVLRSVYRDIELYNPQREPCDIDLSDNTNRFGVPPAAADVIRSVSVEQITRYPSVYAAELKRAIADWYGVDPTNVVTGCGSDDVIDSALRAFCEQGDRVVVPTPTFGMVAEFARMNATRPIAVPLTAELALDAAGLVAAAGQITYICSPNNPTGGAFNQTTLVQLAGQLPGVLLLDEAYSDFSSSDLAQAAAGSERMISLRTFSKAFGLAGLRIGFAIGPTRLVHEIEKSRGPYKVNALAEAAALAVLRHDGAWVRSQIEQVKANRERLFNALVEHGYRPLPSNANFLLVPVQPGQTASGLATSLRQRGVAVRPFSQLPLIGDCIRVSVGPWPMLERFLTELSRA
jgi:histidinol dehydrogenase